MSDEISLDQLTAEDLEVFNNISAMDPYEHTRRVWASGRLPPFVASDRPGTLSRDAFVQVPSLTPEDLAQVYAKLEAIDGPRRIVRN